MITWVSNAYRQQLVQNITDDLDGMTAGLVADRVSHEQTTASQSRLTADICVVVFKIRKGATTDKLVQNMSCNVCQGGLNIMFCGFDLPLKSKDPRVDRARVINAGSFPSVETCEHPFSNHFHLTMHRTATWLTFISLVIAVISGRPRDEGAPSGL
jgi:hypothetical protein